MNKKTKPMKILKNGIFDENPTFRLVLGMCPTLAVSIAAFNAIGMGLAATFVLVCSNVIIAALRNFIPAKVRIPAFIVIIATFVTIVQLVLKAYVPALDKSLGIFIPLIVVNCIILGRAEAFAQKNTITASLLDGIGMGIGFTAALLIVSIIREVTGSLEFFGIPLFGKGLDGALMMVQPPGGFITLGLVLGLINFISRKRKQRKSKGAR
jgi:electron transport complex protein RnfE